MNRLSAMIKLKLFSILFGILCLSCDNEHESPVPDFPVSLTIKTSFPGDGESRLYAGGYGGVIVYCLSQGNYFAYDACCTHELNRNSIVEPDGALGICNTCGSKYIFIEGGYPADGPSRLPLKQYSVSGAGGYIHIWN